MKTKHKFFILFVCNLQVGLWCILTYTAVPGSCLLLDNPNMLSAEGHKNYLHSKISIIITNFNFHEWYPEVLINEIWKKATVRQNSVPHHTGAILILWAN
jgi:hypothetical protein